MLLFTADAGYDDKATGNTTFIYYNDLIARIVRRDLISRGFTVSLLAGTELDGKDATGFTIIR